jgi:hypothetical protein
MSSNEAGFVLARRDYAGPGKKPQKDEVNGDAARRRPRLRASFAGPAQETPPNRERKD